MRNNEVFKHFAIQTRAVGISAAGCGKTELIVRSVSFCDGKQLILTHTHAGVDSIRLRLKKHGIKSKSYRVETIHSFALRYASAYPKLSSIETSKPEKSEDYIDVIKSATRFFSTNLARDIFQNSYCGIFVDEYQDCTIEQHNLIMEIACILPCRIVGDPLQAIFDFVEELVDWKKHVFPQFKNISNPQIPWRWKQKNPKLGKWLTNKVRPQLLKKNGCVFLDKELETIGCYWTKYSARKLTEVLYKSNKLSGCNFAICNPAIQQKPHEIARKLNNIYKSLEPLTSADICEKAEEIENSHGIKRLRLVLDFAKCCLTKISTDCKSILESIEKRQHQFRSRKKIAFYDLSERIGRDDSLSSILDLYIFLENSYKPTIYRYQLWREMLSGLKDISQGNDISLKEAVWNVRNKQIKAGRIIPYRCVSRTVLLKGLECDNTIIIDADDFDTKNLYVAMTRPSNKLYILSNSRLLMPSDKRPKCSKCNKLMLPRQGKYGPFLGCPNFPDCRETVQVKI